MRIAVTGSEGFIGSHVVQALGDHDVLPMDRKHPTHPIELTELDFDWFAREGTEAVVHLAAHADVRENWNQLGHIDRDNHQATHAILDGARYSPKCKTFVYVSTGAVYASNSGFVTEETPCIASSPYAASKLAGEAYVQAYATKCGWRWYVLRPAACFGSGYHHGHVADFVRMAKEDGKIHAVNRGDRRPAVHVFDLTRAIVECATGDMPSGIYNVSGGIWGWRDTVTLMGPKVPVTNDSKMRGWLGDSGGAHWESEKLRRYIDIQHDVKDGVSDALTSLGWSWT